MVKRELQTRIARMASKMPVITITGPRQSGKTTLAKMSFPKYDYVNLETPENRLFAASDPKSFLAQFQKGVIIDEVQYVPELFSYIQVFSDESGKAGQYILTGSHNFLLLEKIAQSLAGRVAIFNLLPFSIAELKRGKLLDKDYEDTLLKGFYPRLHDKALEPSDFYPDYISTYVERDVRQLINVRDLAAFQLFLRLCAGHTGQMLNVNAIANSVGRDNKTIRQWISVLETSFIIFLLQPHHRNFNKRLVKTPKLYFTDTGIAAYLLGIRSIEQLNTHYAKGALFENMMVADIMKNILNQGRRSHLYFWRDNTGNEVDLLFEDDTKLKPVEFKAGKTLSADFFKGLNYYTRISGGNPKDSFLVYGGDAAQKRAAGNVLGWKHALKIVKHSEK